MEQTQSQQVEQSDQRKPGPALPPWPRSKPGPKVTEPPAGMRRIPLRTEQVVELDYNQEEGKSGVRES